MAVVCISLIVNDFEYFLYTFDYISIASINGFRKHWIATFKIIK